MNYFKSILFIGLIGSFISCSKVYIQDISQTSGDLFQSNNLLKVSIISDWETILGDRGDDRTYHSGSIIYEDREKGEISIPVELKVRGNFKRRPTNCDFPPIKVKFKPADAIATIFEGQSELKLFTHCRTGEEAYEQQLLKEYYIYRMYNQLSEVSLRLRLLEISYVDQEKKMNTLVRHAFLMENQDQLAGRLRGQILERPDVQPEQIDGEAWRKMAIFQYMIGNEDWAISPPHNVLMFKANASQSLLPIPYDFDFSSLVRTNNYDSDQIVVGSRRFQGQCYTGEELEQSFQLFREKKTPLDNLIKNTKLLTEHQQEGMLKYLATFYAIIDDPVEVKSEFLDECGTER